MLLACRYNFQQDFMPHALLPEHIILGEIPKPETDSTPYPSVLIRAHGHMHVRRQMARAMDAGFGRSTLYCGWLCRSFAMANMENRCVGRTHEGIQIDSCEARIPQTLNR